MGEGRGLALHTCSPAVCDCGELGGRDPWPSAELADSLSGLTDEEAETIFELLALGQARRAARLGGSLPDASAA